MAFIRSVADEVASDLWPEENRHAIQLRVNGRKLAGWERFPTSLEDIATWASLIKDDNNTNENRNKILVYKSSPLFTPGAFYPVSVHLYGFLQSFQIGTHGNWQRLNHGNGQATEKLVLSCGGNAYDAAWKNQLDSLNLAGTFASKSLQMPLHRRYNSKRLFLQRRIFTGDGASSTTLEAPSRAAIDQASHVNNLQSMNDDCSLFDMDLRGIISPLREDSLNHGDFVEVDVEFDLDVVRLLPASDPSVSVGVKRKVTVEEHQSSTLIKCMRTGLTAQNIGPSSSTRKPQSTLETTTNNLPPKERGRKDDNITTSTFANFIIKNVSATKTASNAPENNLQTLQVSSSTAETHSSKDKKDKCSGPPPLTVKSVIRGPPSAIIDDHEILGYPTTLKSHIEKLISFENPRSNIYSLAALLPTASWGRNDPYTDRSKMLCDPVSNEPLLIWMVGHHLLTHLLVWYVLPVGKVLSTAKRLLYFHPFTMPAKCFTPKAKWNFIQLRN
ncbi:hypothetical protein BKA82DRAFT_4424707 [Pisolithus tinctorius]|nr:hypothetical protein BKA82DRAFT_4424707 [Pisolithus tinctorius]